jgi:hypothetical protein
MGGIHAKMQRRKGWGGKDQRDERDKKDGWDGSGESGGWDGEVVDGSGVERT